MKTGNKLLFLCLISTFAISACSKSEIIADEKISNDVLTEAEGQEQFAVILSKAVVAEPSLRSFIKDEALKQYDKDYDVFYPFVKGRTINNGETFREMILRYSEGESHLSQIEAAVPKLTILVPDYSWVSEQCFTVRNWDPASNHLAVGFDDRLEAHPVYYNGDKIGNISASSFPTFPVLIVKSNERMIVSETTTKGGERSYDFLDPAFDGMSTKGHIEGQLINYWDSSSHLVDNEGDKISFSDMSALSPETIQAFNIFGVGWNGGVQRDHIYYGMSQTNTNNGSLNLFERDLIFRFSLPVSGLLMCADNTNDPHLNTTVLYTGKGDRPNINEAIQRMWGNGKFEFRIDSYSGVRNGGAILVGQHVLSIDPHELVYVSEGYFTFDWTLFNNWGSFTISTNNFHPKWYYPLEHGQFLIINNNWDLFTSSDNLRVVVTEVDTQTTTMVSETIGFKYSDSVTSSLSGGLEYMGIKIGLGVSGTYGNESTVSTTCSITKTDGADDMGSLFVDYVDNIILSTDESNNYLLKKYQTGVFNLCIVPVDTRREYAIRAHWPD